MMELEGTLPYKGYNIRIRNGAFGGISATVFSASGQPLATLIGDYSEEAKKRAKTWIDNQDESDATLFLGSLAQRDQDVDRLEKELAAANERIAALEAENAALKDERDVTQDLLVAMRQRLFMTTHDTALYDMVGDQTAELNRLVYASVDYLLAWPTVTSPSDHPHERQP
jgi:flagellar motility protein MotE (MotC chaperone)